MNERARTLENKYLLMTGLTEIETLAQNLQYKIARDKQLLHTLNITRLKLLQSVSVVVSDEELPKVKSYQHCKILLCL